MKTVILSESQVKNVIDRILSEQNEIRTEALTVNFDAVWAMGMWKLTSQQSGPIVQKLIQVTDFINKNKGSVVTIQIEAGESQVTNVDNEDPAKPKLQAGVLSQRRGEQMVNFLTQYFQGLVSKGAIDKMPEFPAPITKIGTTSYKAGSTDLKTKKTLYQQEQFVRAIISAKKDYECLVGMEITVGYFPGKSSADHTCDEAIFELRMNGVSLGEANLNNSRMDTSLGAADRTNQQAERTYQNRLKKAQQSYLDAIKDGTIKMKKDPQKAEEQRKKYLEDYGVGAPPVKKNPPSWLTPLALKNGYETINEFEAAILKINQSFAEYGRKSDGQNGGARSQTFVLDGTKAKSIIDNAPSDKIILSIVPLVSQNGKYKMFHQKGSHADTPWVTIQSKKSDKPLFDGEPNVGMSRGSTKETVLLQTDLCGNPIKTQGK
jgi:hypothetical protein